MNHAFLYVARTTSHDSEFLDMMIAITDTFIIDWLKKKHKQTNISVSKLAQDVFPYYQQRLEFDFSVTFYFAFPFDILVSNGSFRKPRHVYMFKFDV